MKAVTLFALGLCLAGSVCASPSDRAVKLTASHLLVDTHIDVPYRIHDHWADIGAATEDGDFDYPRAREGGLNALFMSIYIPAEEEGARTAYRTANILIDQVEAMVHRAPDKFAMAYSTADLERQFEQGLISFALGMENGAPIEGDLEKLAHFERRGVRYITLAHSLSNHISDSSYDKVRLWQGLSPFGAEVVREMNRLGVMIDVSHLSDAAFEQVLALSKVPVIASHSSARHFTPDFERNMSDDMLRAMADNAGVVMINFGSSFLTKEANAYFTTYMNVASVYAERHGYSADSKELKVFEESYRSKHPFPFATVVDVADHIDRVVKKAGIDHVGLGSDYDGVGDSLPVGLKDVSTYPNLVDELLARRYSEEDIAKILGGNLMRVWKAVEQGTDQ